jgi:alkanesulfonate monooxygenase SsuD/methylene tetrahydromethanopterin reductase-like flavin-dependent oxidoreductase (luciferase family)
MVLNNDLRHPVLVAREAAPLDLLSDGRLELGLGAGHMKSEYDTTFEPYLDALAPVVNRLAGT